MLVHCASNALTLRGRMSDREDTIAWVKAVLAFKKWTATEWARKARLAPSTLNRFLNDPKATHDLTAATKEALASVAGVEPMQIPGGRRAGFSEADAQPYSVVGSTGDDLVDKLVEELIAGKNGIDPWVMRTRALEHVGYMPGDILLVALNEKPQPRDAVCAQVYDWVTGKAETVMRIYEPPFLIPATSDPRLVKPFIVDDDMVVIKGVIVNAIRPRRARVLAA